MITSYSSDLQWDWLIKKCYPVSYTFRMSQNHIHKWDCLPGSHNPELLKYSLPGNRIIFVLKHNTFSGSSCEHIQNGLWACLALHILPSFVLFFTLSSDAVRWYEILHFHSQQRTLWSALICDPYPYHTSLLRSMITLDSLLCPTLGFTVAQTKYYPFKLIPRDPKQARLETFPSQLLIPE